MEVADGISQYVLFCLDYVVHHYYCIFGDGLRMIKTIPIQDKARLRACCSWQAGKWIAPGIDRVETLVPKADVWEFRQRQPGAFGERQRRCDPEIGV